MKKITAFLLVLSLMLFVPERAKAVEVSARSAIVVNAATGEVIFSQNAEERLPMASTTKIMTALLLCEMADLNDTVITTKEMVTVEGSSMGLLEGDTVSYKALLYGMMLPSGNDAATTTAIALGGSLREFALLMNKKARELSMDNTNFVTPSGLDAENHYSTAADMAKLAVYAMKNPLFRKVAATKSISVEYGNPPYTRRLSGHNKILDIYSGGIGIKTGYTSKSGRCLVSAATRHGVEVIAVNLGDSNTWAHHKQLLDLGFSKINSVTFSAPTEAKKLRVISGQTSEAALECEDFTIGLTPEEQERVTYKISLPEFSFAPLSRGEEIGKIDYYLDGNLLKSLSLKTAEAVPMATPPTKNAFDDWLQNFKIMLKL